jgi:hypothetical protein
MMKRYSFMSAAIVVILFGLLSVGTAVLADFYIDGYAEAAAKVTTPDTKIAIHDESGSADAYAQAKIGNPSQTSPPPTFTFSTSETDSSSGQASATTTARATGNSRADDEAYADIDYNSTGTATAVSSAVAIDNSYSGNETEAIITNYATGTATATSTATATGSSQAGNYTTAIINGAGDMFVPDSLPQVVNGFHSTATGTATAIADATATNNSSAGNMVMAGIMEGEGSAYAEASAVANNGSWAGSITQALVGNYGPGNIASANSWSTADNNSRAGVISVVGILPEGMSGEFTTHGFAMADGGGESLGLSAIGTDSSEEEFFYGDISFSPVVSVYQPGLFVDVAGGAEGFAFAIVYVESLTKATTLTFTYGLGGDAAAMAVINGTEILVDAMVGQDILDEFDVPGFGIG